MWVLVHDVSEKKERRDPRANACDICACVCCFVSRFYVFSFFVLSLIAQIICFLPRPWSLKNLCVLLNALRSQTGSHNGQNHFPSSRKKKKKKIAESALRFTHVRYFTRRSPSGLNAPKTRFNTHKKEPHHHHHHHHRKKERDIL